MSNATVSAEDGQLLWTPGLEQLNSSRLVQYQQWLADKRGCSTTRCPGASRDSCSSTASITPAPSSLMICGSWCVIPAPLSRI